jgi:type IV fimbrial biogenesis protein FimT
MPTPDSLISGHAALQRGVTLVEACIVLAVTAIVASLAAPNMRALIDARRLDGAATQLATDLQFARSETVARNRPLRLSVYPGPSGSCYVIHSGAAGDCRCGADEGPAQCTGNASAIKTVTLASSDRVDLQSNVASMLFDPVHGTVTPTATLRLRSGDGREVRQIINIVGRVRSCSPQAAAPGYRAC